MLLYTLTISVHRSLSAGSDFKLSVATITIHASEYTSCFDVEIIADTDNEGTENFFVELVYSGSHAAVSVIAPSTVEVLVLG